MRLSTFAVASLLAGVSSTASAQPSTGGGRFGTTVSLQAGLTSGTMDLAGATLGGTVLKDLGSRVAIEGSASYVGEGMGGDSLSLTVSALFHLRPTRKRAAPYLALGGGLYRSTFDMGDQRMYGVGGHTHDPHDRGAMAFAPDLHRGAGMMGGSYGPGVYGNLFGHMPGFYANRLPAGMDPQEPRSGHRTFTDPAVSVGGGVRIGLGSRMFLRPDGRVLVVTSDGDSFTVGVVAVNFGWRF